MDGGGPRQSEYEQRQIKAIQEWVNLPSPLSARAMRRTGQAARDAGRVIRRVARNILPDGVTEHASDFVKAAYGHSRLIVPTGAIEGVLHANMWLADQWADQQSVLRNLRAGSFEELKHYDLEVLDRVASQVHNWAVAIGGGVGGAAGAGGILLAVPGVLAVINISLRTIRKVGLCYGYAALDDLEKRFIFSVLALGGSSDQAAKLASAKVLREIQVMVAQRTFRSMAQNAAQDRMGKEAFVMGARAAAKKLGFQLTKRRILVSIPLVGGGVGLFVDGNHLRRVGWDAFRSYQRRWLIDRGRWPHE